MARALANECSNGDRRVAFFMRKGADCLSKWVGESERHLRLLFDQVSPRLIAHIPNKTAKGALVQCMLNGCCYLHCGTSLLALAVNVTSITFAGLPDETIHHIF